ncbi:MAG: VWA domain-containing protein [Acidobacteriota bacterium]
MPEIWPRAFVGSVALVALAIRLAAHSSPPQQPSPTQPSPSQAVTPPVEYAVDVSLIEVDAVVTDGDGHVIRGLRKDDFQVLEDGRPQTIDRLSFVEIPIERSTPAAPADPVSDVQSNVHRFDGRLYVLLLDDLHTAATRAERVKAAARRFVDESLQPGDLAAVVHVSGAAGASQDFTSNHQLLLASIDRFGGRQLRSETLNEIDEYNRQYLLSGRTPQKTSDINAPQRVTDIEEEPRAHDARSTFETMAAIARRLAPVRGRRKALLWFGEGISYDMFDEGRTQASTVRESSRAAVAAASAANMAIYGIDARGLAGMSAEAVQLSSPPADPSTNMGAAGLNQELLRSQVNLQRASSETGGFAVTNSDGLSPAFTRVVAENSAYYLLAYYPTEPRRDGTFHRLDVRVNRPGARVRARSGYISGAQKSAAPVNAEPGAPAALRDALASPVPLSGLPMAIHVAPFKGADRKASVLVTIEYGAAAFDESGVVASSQDRLDTSVIATDPAGRIAQSDHATITLNVKPETLKAMRVLGFRTHARLDLSPGRYQVRVAALIRGKGLVGSVHEDIEVPDFSGPALTMSGLAVTSMVAGYTPTARFDDRMREVLPAPPSAVRDFRNDEAIALYAEVYSSGGVPAAGVHFTTRIVDRAGRTAFEREDLRTADELKHSRNGYWLQISLRQLPPGQYLLRLEAATSAGGQASAARETSFGVWKTP